jgi:hypothetical protein
MKAALFLLAFAAAALAQSPEETPTPPPDPKIDFKVTVVGNRKEFHIGEIIPIKLSFGSRLKRRYQIDEASYDRSGRMNFEYFIVAPADGAEDPLAEYFSPDSVHLGGGMTSSSFLAPKPWTIQLNLNEWVRFTKPGEYTLKVASRRVEAVDSSKPHGTEPATALSNEITLKILPRDEAWEKRTYDRALATLRDPSSTKRNGTGNSAALDAMEILRFLGTGDATRELAKRIRSDEGYFPGTCFFGLISSPERAVAREALEGELAKPDRPIDDSFLDALIWFETHDNKSDPKSTAGKEKALGKALRALPNKHDEILPLCLYSLVNSAGVRGGKFLPNDIDRLIEQLFAIFDRLTPEQKHSLLSYWWTDMRRLTPAPLLKRYAEQEWSDPNSDIHYNPRTIAALALRRWFELDPDGARPAVIAEISRVKPRFGVRELGFLPDRTLPGVDRLLAEHFHGDEDFDTASNFASLIARYGTREILPQILPKLDAKVGHWAPDIEDPLLAYVLRVDPEAARPRIEKALVGRVREGVWVQNVFQSIAAIHYDPVLEQVAIRALDGSNRAIASSAAIVLAGYGSNAAKTALWQRYEKWCQRWAGQERQVNLKAVDAQYEQEGGTNELMLGQSLAAAIAHGQKWLTGEPELRRLRTMSKVPTIQLSVDSWLEKWRRLPLQLGISSCGPANGAASSDVWQSDRFSAYVVQYLDFDSISEFKEKLSQFPPGTKFELWLPWEKDDRTCIDDLRAFLASHEFSVTDAKIDDGS